MLLLLIPFTLLYACKTPMIISTSEKDATITVNGIEQGAGRTSLLRLGKNKVFNVKIEKTGFLPEYSLSDGIKELIKGYTMLKNQNFGNF